ncbi:Inactive TPR repeat-containing thioredoxin TTL3 [Linum perenne]
MSQYAKKPADDPLALRFRDTLSCSNSTTPKKKPADSSRELDLGSPVSPLPTRNLAAATSNTAAATTSSGSTSGSSGSVSGKAGNCSELTSEISTGRLDSARSGPNNGRASHPGHRRSSSAGAPLIYAGSSFGSGPSNGATSAASPGPNLLPSGNICPSGKIVKKIGLPSRVPTTRPETLGMGKGHYGHGSIMRGGSGGSGGGLKAGSGSYDPEEVKREGNEMYKRGNFGEALAMYDKAIHLSPDNAAYRSNRAAALTALGRLTEAVKECEEAVRLDPGYARAHQRLASLYLRLGQADEARRHVNLPGQQPDPLELHKLQLLEKHLNQCVVARKTGDWKSVLRETDGALAVGIDSSRQLLGWNFQLIACRAEAFLKLCQHENADSTISKVPKFESCSPQAKFFGMLSEAYVLYVRAQVEMALGRFDNAVSLTEKAVSIDHVNIELSMALNKMKTVARARTHGNDLFSSGKYAEASSAYGEGLKHDTSNAVLYCNRSVCWSKLGLWEKSVEDCSQALKIQPNYTKALLRRAASNGKLGRWAEAVTDYEMLRQELPFDNEVVEHLRWAEDALKKSRGQIYDGKLGGEVEEVCRLEKFKAAISSPGVAVIHFKAEGDEQSDDMSPFMNMLCVRYPSIHFFKVNVGESLAIAKAESIRTIPTFKIYKNGGMVKEIIRPSHQFLEDSVRSYSL